MARSAKERQRAYRIERKLDPKGGGLTLDQLDEDDRVFIIDYRHDQELVAASSATHASEKIVSTHVEERSLAQAQGNGAVIIDSAADLAKAEGQRLDTITALAINTMKDCVTFYRGMAADLLLRSKEQDAAHVALLDAMREHFIARTQAEAAIAANEQLQTANSMGELAPVIEILKLVKDPDMRELIASLRKAPDPSPK